MSQVVVSKRSLQPRRLGFSKPSNHYIHQGIKWLTPGLLVKRWMLLSMLGLLLVVWGLAIWTQLSPAELPRVWGNKSLGLWTRFIPSTITGPLVTVGGLLLHVWGQRRMFKSIGDALVPRRNQTMVDMILSYQQIKRGPKIVVVGGGTGLSTLLRGLKNHSSNLTAIVTVADDGGSSGRLRREMGVQPPGDIRSCVTALASEEKVLTELFNYRFKEGEGLAGHSFGNLFLTAMTNVTGDFEQAITASSEVLAIQGTVLPATLTDVSLWAKMEDGRVIHGESNIPKANGKIIELGCTPARPKALPRALEAIKEADFIILGPGSLYTSIIPNLLVPEIATAIEQAKVPRIYLCNVMTQSGETTDYSVSDHISALDQACGFSLFDTVLVQQNPPSSVALERYSRENSRPVQLDEETIRSMGRQVVTGNIVQEEPNGLIRHDSQKLGQVLMRWYAKRLEQSSRRKWFFVKWN